MGSLKRKSRRKLPPSSLIYPALGFVWNSCKEKETVQEFYNSPGVLSDERLAVFQRRETKPDGVLQLP